MNFRGIFNIMGTRYFKHSMYGKSTRMTCHYETCRQIITHQLSGLKLYKNNSRVDCIYRRCLRMFTGYPNKNAINF